MAVRDDRAVVVPLLLRELSLRFGGGRVGSMYRLSDGRRPSVMEAPLLRAWRNWC